MKVSFATVGWWIKNALIFSASVFFLFLGIGNIIGSYRLTNPGEFVLYFFSASFMILISMTGIIYVFFRLMAFFKARR